MPPPRRMHQHAQTHDGIECPIRTVERVGVANLKHDRSPRLLGALSSPGVRVLVLDSGHHVAEADVRRVERIVRNLVTNAIDHAEGHDVEIRVASDETSTALSVRDHGVGLAPGETSMVFNRFWRADPARARTSGGTGLGLSISLEDTHLHGGWLQAWGRPGEGAQFRLTLPRRASAVLRQSPLPLIPAALSAQRLPQRLCCYCLWFASRDCESEATHARRRAPSGSLCQQVAERLVQASDQILRNPALSSAVVQLT